MLTTLEVIIYKSNEVLFKGHPADAREKIEDMIRDSIGFCPSLQENEENGAEEWIYLHTDAYDDCSEEELSQLERLRITEDGETSTEAITRLLQVSFEIVPRDPRVFTADMGEHGKIVGESDEGCEIESCSGTVHLVEWKNGEVTQCCSAGLVDLENGDMRISN